MTNEFDEKLKEIIMHWYRAHFDGKEMEPDKFVAQIKQLISEVIGEDEHLMGVLGDDQFLQDIGTNNERNRLRHAFNLKGE